MFNTKNWRLVQLSEVEIGGKEAVVRTCGFLGATVETWNCWSECWEVAGNIENGSYLQLNAPQWEQR